jgi:hypothetical protein
MIRLWNECDGARALPGANECRDGQLTGPARQCRGFQLKSLHLPTRLGSHGSRALLSRGFSCGNGTS